MIAHTICNRMAIESESQLITNTKYIIFVNNLFYIKTHTIIDDVIVFLH